ncbi:prepilin-type N-terminal cleavage/methylation domain-containing protein [Prosthecobacter fusiformis]|nr:prepilin-type N-terminal cleavage/methylation domain-containing protein [Prosthecobacter fusiformis]
MFINLPPNKNCPGSLLPGFSLMEVVIALTILGMITGTLFSIIQGSVRAASQVEQLQRENDSINRFLDICRKAFTTLPSTATLTLTALDPNNPTSSGQELTISGSTHCFSFGINPISYEDTILGLRPDPNGATDANGLLLQYLSLSRDDLIPQSDSGMALRQETSGLSAPDEQGRYWMPLLPDVVQLKWRFYKEDDDTWLEEWDDSEWPALIEVQLVMKDRTTPIRMVYSVPTITIIAASTRSSSTSTSSANQSTQSNQNNRGGGNQAGGRGEQDGGGEEKK